jgi:hypothetical protein
MITPEQRQAIDGGTYEVGVALLKLLEAKDLWRSSVEQLRLAQTDYHNKSTKHQELINSLLEGAENAD